MLIVVVVVVVIVVTRPGRCDHISVALFHTGSAVVTFLRA